MKGDNDEEEIFGIYFLKLKECIRVWREKRDINDQEFLAIYF